MPLPVLLLLGFALSALVLVYVFREVSPRGFEVLPMEQEPIDAETWLLMQTCPSRMD